MTAAAKFDGDPARRRAMAKVQIARKELRLDDSSYRAMLYRLTGHASAADCSEAELGRVLDELKAKGWTPASPPRKARRADHPAARKARALWVSLHQLGVVRNRSEAALEAFARRQLQVERLQWADQAQVYKLIEALKAMAERASWSQDLAGVPAELQVATLKRRLLALLCARAGAVIPECAGDHLDTWISLAAKLPEKGGA